MFVEPSCIPVTDDVLQLDAGAQEEAIGLFLAVTEPHEHMNQARVVELDQSNDRLAFGLRVEVDLEEPCSVELPVSAVYGLDLERYGPTPLIRGEHIEYRHIPCEWRRDAIAMPSDFSTREKLADLAHNLVGSTCSHVDILRKRPPVRLRPSGISSPATIRIS